MSAILRPRPARVKARGVEGANASRGPLSGMFGFARAASAATSEIIRANDLPESAVSG